MPPTETPELVTDDEAKARALAQHAPEIDLSFEGRMLWPYLAGFHAGGHVPKNARERGCWIAGHLYGRQMHGEPGLRVQMKEEEIAGVCAVLLDYGLTVTRWSRDDATGHATIDVWSA